MPDVFSPEKRSDLMRRVRQKDTGPELRVRRLLWRLGARYRLHRRDLPGSPDVVMPGRRLAIFVHGCFWHAHDCPRGARKPRGNADYWGPKLERNRERDAAATTALTGAGWKVETIWECELRAPDALETRLRRLLEVEAPLPPRSAGKRESPPTG